MATETARCLICLHWKIGSGKPPASFVGLRSGQKLEIAKMQPFAGIIVVFLFVFTFFPFCLIWIGVVCSIKLKKYCWFWSAMSVPVYFIALIAFIIALDYAHDHYLKIVPPREQISGSWLIDKSRTTWPRNIGSHDGHLNLKPDGRFSIEDLPDFSFGTSPIDPVQYQPVSGHWRTDVNVGDGRPYLMLNFEEVNGTVVKDKFAFLYFRGEQDNFYLVAIIFDPDSGDELVLQRRK